MKKIIILAAAMCSFATYATIYQVYDFTMKATYTTGAKGRVTTSCGDDYIYRDKSKQTIKGIIAGCGCDAIKADGSANNALVILWNETTKTQITNAEFNAWIVQRIGKTGKVVEHIAEITCEDFTVYLGGLGTYAINKTDSENDYVKKISGNFAGFGDVASLFTDAECLMCGIGPQVDLSQALPVCEEGLCNVSMNSDITPFAGTYTLSLNSSKTKKASKHGASRSTLGLPVYVDIPAQD